MTMVTVIDAVVLRPLPYAEPDRLVVLLHESRNPVAPANYLDWKRQSTVFSDVGAAEYWAGNLMGDVPERVQGLRVTADILRMTGVRPILGRLLLPEEEAPSGERAAVLVGRLTAHLNTLRQMSLSVAAMLQAGKSPNLEASVVKDIGTTFEQEIPELVHALIGAEPHLNTGSEFEKTLGYLVQHAPSFSLRGGTREILRGIIARGLGLR